MGTKNQVSHRATGTAKTTATRTPAKAAAPVGGRPLYVHADAGWQLVRVTTESRFQTREFRKNKWVRKFCRQVRTMYVLESLDGGPIENLPAGYFGTYFRCTPKRKYANPWLEDLYWLHELAHLVTWRSGGRCEPPALTGRPETWYDWQLRMVASELFAAVASECLAHVFIDGLRDKVFTGQPIWVDRFLEDETLMRRFRKGEVTKKGMRRRITKAREAVLRGGSSMDYVELQIQGYRRTNVIWAKMFTTKVGYGPHASLAAFRCIEAHLPDVHDPALHTRWILEVTPTLADLARLGLGREYRLPFAVQAKAFADVFLRYYAESGNDVFYA